MDNKKRRRNSVATSSPRNTNTLCFRFSVEGRVKSGDDDEGDEEDEKDDEADDDKDDDAWDEDKDMVEADRVKEEILEPSSALIRLMVPWDNPLRWTACCCPGCKSSSISDCLC